MDSLTKSVGERRIPETNQREMIFCLMSKFNTKEVEKSETDLRKLSRKENYKQYTINRLISNNKN